MAKPPAGTFSETLLRLGRKGVRYATVIDLGCADGHFFVSHYVQGLFAGAVPVNIDANALYEPSLQAVRDAVSGHYRIAAVSDAAGELTLTTSVHPYWGSLRPAGDLYWQRLNNLVGETRTVPTLRLDDLAQELGLQPPYLLKLDIQGAEVQALRGAATVLSGTDVLIVEADIADFQAINAVATGAGFSLFDLTEVNRTSTGELGWFYPVYVSARLAHLSEPQFWRAANNEAIVKMQAERREKILAWLGKALPEIKARRRPTE